MAARSRQVSAPTDGSRVRADTRRARANRRRDGGHAREDARTASQFPGSATPAHDQHISQDPQPTHARSAEDVRSPIRSATPAKRGRAAPAWDGHTAAWRPSTSGFSESRRFLSPLRYRELVSYYAPISCSIRSASAATPGFFVRSPLASLRYLTAWLLSPCCA